MSKAIDKQFEVFNLEVSKNLSVASSRALNKLRTEVVEETAREIKKHFFYPGDPNTLLHKTSEQRGVRFSKMTLSWLYKSIPLSQYPVRQIRITTGNRKLYTFRHSVGAFKSKIVSEEFVVKTLTRIRKSKGFQIVGGTRGQKGFLHTGRKLGSYRYKAHHATGEISFGYVSRFSAKILERNQRPTWRGGIRLPVHQLFGPSLTQLLQTTEMQKFFQAAPVFARLEKHVIEALLSLK